MAENYLFRLRRRGWALLVILIAIISIFALTRGISNSAKITAIAQEATRKAATDARVIARFGDGLAISGQHSGEAASGGVKVVVPVTGSRGRGTLHATGIVEDDRATLSSLTVVAGRERIDVPISSR